MALIAVQVVYSIEAMDNVLSAWSSQMENIIRLSRLIHHCFNNNMLELDRIVSKTAMHVRGCWIRGRYATTMFMTTWPVFTSLSHIVIKIITRCCNIDCGTILQQICYHGWTKSLMILFTECSRTLLIQLTTQRWSFLSISLMLWADWD